MCGSAVRAIPVPLSTMRKTTRPVLDRSTERDHPAVLGELRGVVQDVAEGLGETIEVAVDKDALDRRGDGEPLVVLVDDGSCGLDRLVDDPLDIDRPDMQRNFARCHSRRVEQVVDHARQLVDLAPDDVMDPVEHRLVRRDPVQHGNRVRNRRERVSHFVRQHGKKIFGTAVAAVVRPFGCVERRRALRRGAPHRLPRR